MNRRLLGVGALALSVVFAALSLHQVIAGWMYLVRVGVAVTAACGVVVAGQMLGLRRRYSPIAVVLTWFLVVAYAVLPSTTRFGLPTPTTVRRIGSGLVDGWPEALDDFLPLASNPPVLVLIVTVAFFLTALAADMTVHSERVVPPLVAPLGVLGLALPLAAPFGGYRWWTIAAALAGIFGFLLIRANPVHDIAADLLVDGSEFGAADQPSGALLRGMPIVVASIAVGLVLSGPLSLGRDEPYDPRAERGDTIVEQPVLNPLASFKAIANQDPPRPAFTLDFVVDGDREIVDRVSLLVLDTYDGETWESGQRFILSNGELPGAAGSDSNTLVPQRYTIASVPPPWLPAVARPVRIEADGVSFDQESAVLIGDVTDYLVVSEVVDRETIERDTVGVAADEASRRYRELPEAFSAEMAELADRITEGTASPFEQLEQLREYFAADFGFDPEARSGHSLGRVEELLSDNRVGNAEQYATVYALLARSLGIPSRLVVGYDLTTAVDENGDGQIEVTSAHYDVWVEAKFADGHGWVAFDPTPVDAPFDAAPDQSPGTTIAQGQAPRQGSSPGEAGPSQAPNDDVEARRGLAGWVVPVVVVGFVLLWAVIFALAIVVTKARRRSSRRRAASVTHRVEGAWADARDRMIESGVGVSRAMTLSEVVIAGSTELGGETVEPLRNMVPDVSRAAYAMDPPAAETAARAWDHADNFSYTLRASQPWTRRLLARLNPKPLLRR